MNFFNSDLHIHSPHSIAVSKTLNLDTMVETCKKKGLNILGTGDILQPDWLKYMENKLEKNNDGSFSYKGIFFILQTEIEDNESIHHLVLLPDFETVRKIKKEIEPHSKNVSSEWGGRPRVNLSAPELADIIDDNGGLIGPAHAFTPFKAIFRQNKFENLQDCYQDSLKKIFFIELGLSANTDLADRLDCLKNVIFLSNSDAHSEGPRSLGREFNRFYIDKPTFEEISLAIRRKNNRKITLNVGLHPKLGKYYNMFCSKCRRRVIFKELKDENKTILNSFTFSKDFIVIYSNNPEKERLRYLDLVSKEKITCPACRETTGKNYKIRLGVSERIEIISQYQEPKHPSFRPPYINTIPLIEIVRSIKRIKSTSSKTVMKIYNELIESLGKEYEILVDLPIEKIKKVDSELATIIKAFRNDEIKYIPGGGGVYGQIKIDVD